MTKKNDGGPAFPRAAGQTERGFNRPQDGMSLRDWFAGQALDALIEDICRPSEYETADKAEHPRQTVARRAYAIADAMLEARK